MLCWVTYKISQEISKSNFHNKNAVSHRLLATVSDGSHGFIKIISMNGRGPLRRAFPEIDLKQVDRYYFVPSSVGFVSTYEWHRRFF